uniref:Oxygen-insensitive NAD(P)H nitroreductase n=1 Tax=uncultured bacterium Contig1532b TaxID=1393450 RepID=W0FG84_9BACT|nr:oxygen-insensitive NAD(P)H nitroreductase [uncultured bacterium Contig1532b]
MNDLIRAMEERRSIRSFKPDEPRKEDLDKIIEAGLYAASGMGRQGAIIVAVTNKEVRDRLSEANRVIGGWDEGFDPFYGAPAILIVLGNREFPTYLYDGSLVMGNLMNAAYSLGLGSIWIHRAKEEFQKDEWKALLKDLGIEGDYEGIGHCAVGYMEGELPEPPARNDGRVFYVK